MSGVLLYGWYGGGNIGDEAVLAALVQMLRDRQPALAIAALSVNPQQTQQLHGITAIRRSPLAARAAIRSCDTFALGGGGTVQDVTSVWNLPSFLAYPMLAKRMGKRVVWSGIGVGPLGTKLGRALTGRAVRATDAITVRDEPSATLLRSLKSPPASFWQTRPPQVTADPALALRPIEREEAVKILAAHGIYIDVQTSESDDKQQPKLVIFAVRRPLDPKLGSGLHPSYLLPVSLRERFGRWSPSAEALYQQTVAQLTRLADYCVSAWGAQVLFVPFDPVDRKVAATIIATMQHPASAHELAGTYHPAAIMGILGLADAVIAMRLHALIFGAAMGRPLIALNYDNKVINFMRRLGMEDWAIAITEAAALLEKAAALWPRRHELAAEVAARAAELKERANLNADSLIVGATQ